MRRPNYNLADTTRQGLKRVAHEVGVDSYGLKHEVVAKIADRWHETNGEAWADSSAVTRESAYACYYAESERFK